MSDNVIPITRERRELIHRLEAAYSGHTYDVYKVNPPAQTTRKGKLLPEDAPYVVINSLNPRYYLSAHMFASQAIRAAQAIHDQHYREYLDVLAAEVDKRGYTDEDVFDIIQIMQATDLYRAGKKLRRTQRKHVEGLIRKHPAELVTEALSMHAARAKLLWDTADRVDRLRKGIYYYIHQVTEGD